MNCLKCGGVGEDKMIRLKLKVVCTECKEVIPCAIEDLSQEEQNEYLAYLDATEDDYNLKGSITRDELEFLGVG
jgi:hypothetical protein